LGGMGGTPRPLTSSSPGGMVRGASAVGGTPRPECSPVSVPSTVSVRVVPDPLPDPTLNSGADATMLSISLALAATWVCMLCVSWKKPASRSSPAASASWRNGRTCRRALEGVVEDADEVVVFVTGPRGAFAVILHASCSFPTRLCGELSLFTAKHDATTQSAAHLRGRAG
jgi:hypothetical protein